MLVGPFGGGDFGGEKASLELPWPGRSSARSGYVESAGDVRVRLRRAL